jgi:tetratricopeptide (TPR) repeat protein
METNGTPFSSARLSEVTASRVDDRTRYAVREHFDIGAFGVNAFAVAEAGQVLIDEHTEQGAGESGHEELYLVVAGRAKFTVNDEEIDAPAGTFVFVRDPAARRKAEAAEAETLVLVVGGSRGEAFRIASWEYSSRAYRLHEAGDLEGALATFERGLQEFPDDVGLLYNLACVESLSGIKESALAHLRSAVDRDPQVREWARGDEDLDAIRGDPAFPA